MGDPAVLPKSIVAKVKELREHRMYILHAGPLASITEKHGLLDRCDMLILEFGNNYVCLFLDLSRAFAGRDFDARLLIAEAIGDNAPIEVFSSAQGMTIRIF